MKIEIPFQEARLAAAQQILAERNRLLHLATALYRDAVRVVVEEATRLTLLKEES